MTRDVKDLRVLITAGAQGIGWAIATAFLEQGAQVHICDINREQLASCQEKFLQLGTSVTNVADIAQVEHCIDDAIKHMGGIDVLVNNAGIAGPVGATEDLAPDLWQDTMQVNINSHFYFARSVIPHLKAQRQGSIVNISSTAGLFGYPFRAPYVASKWAVIGLTKTLAMELGEYGICVNVICPGSINNARMDKVIALDAKVKNLPEDEVRQGYVKQVSLQTFIEPEDIAQMVLFICSPLGAKISGQALSVDGHTETLRT